MSAKRAYILIMAITAMCFLLPLPANAVSVNASWDAVTQDINDDPEAVSHYVLYWGTSSGSYSYERNVGNTTSETIDDIVCTPHCYFSVRAIDTYGNVSDHSAEFDFLLPYPDAPSGLALNVRSSSQIDISWNANGTLTEHFSIERDQGCTGSYAEIATVNENATSYSDVGLSASTQYCYRVRAWNNRGYSSYSNEASATTDDPVVSPPGVPSGLSAAAISHLQINLSWNDLSDEEEYQLQRSLSAGSGYATIATLGINVTSYQDTGLDPATTYYYRIRAGNSAGYSSYSSYVYATTDDPPPEPPSAPSALSADAVDYATVELSWSDNSDNEEHFVLQRRIQGQINFISIAEPSMNATAYTDITVSAETSYEYRIYATNAQGDSSGSNTVSVTTPEAPLGVPMAPSDISISQIDGDTITVTWRDNSDNENGFKIMRKTGLDGEYAERADMGAESESYEDSDFEGDTTYYYLIYAYNEAGQSTPTDEIAITTKVSDIEYVADEGPMYSVTGGCGNLNSNGNRSNFIWIMLLLLLLSIWPAKNR